MKLYGPVIHQVTWLRNTLINQSILLLLLSTVLAFVNFIFYSWTHLINVPAEDSTTYIFLRGAVMILPPCVIAGLGMHMYNRDRPRQSLLHFGKSRFLSLFLVACAIISSLFISAWIFALVQDKSVLTSGINRGFWEKLETLVPASVIAVTGMLLIAFFGRYNESLDDLNTGRKPLLVKSEWVFGIILSSIIASTAGIILLFGMWEFFRYIVSLKGK